MAAEFEDWAMDRLMSLSKMKLHEHAFREIVHHLYELKDFSTTAAVARLCGDGAAVLTFLAEFSQKKKELPALPVLQLTNERETADLQLSMLPALKSAAKINLHERAFREIIGHLADLNHATMAVYLSHLCADDEEADAFGEKFVSEKERLLSQRDDVIDLDTDEEATTTSNEPGATENEPIVIDPDDNADLPVKKPAAVKKESASVNIGSAPPQKQLPASSQDLLLRSMPAKPIDETVGFLHLPTHVRNRIYELAVYDHDRTAVFLPRGVPRKVEPGIDDVDLTLWQLNEHDPKLAWATQTGQTAPLWHWTKAVHPVAIEVGADAAGFWVEGAEDLYATSLEILRVPPEIVDHLSDWDILHSLDENSNDEDSGDGDSGDEDSDDENSNDEDNNDELDTAAVAERTGAQVKDEETADTPAAFTHNAVDEDFNLVELPSDRSTSSIEPGSIDNRRANDLDNDSPSAEQAQDSDNSDESEQSDESYYCRGCPCGDADCHDFCDRREEWEASVEPGRNVFTMMDHDDLDDIERYDADERIGMHYELTEPGILLACKEIRAQCLPVYYKQNAFSWRFLWTDYQRACRRFKSWVMSIGAEHVKLVTKITFQGRHRVEEGLEFAADIDLIERDPFYKISVYVDDDSPVLKSVAATIGRELAIYLQAMAQSKHGRPILSIGHFCELASIFVQGMHRDGGGCVTDDAGQMRLILSPLF